MRDEAKAPNPRGVYFDAGQLDEPEYDYVCWLDVMGTRNQMLRSVPAAATFMFKLQCAVLEAGEEVGLDEGVRLYPVMDGVYITSRHRQPLQDILNQTLCRLAITFLKEQTPYYQFLARGAIAFGPVYHGADLNPNTSKVLAKHPLIRDSILMGLPMAQAYRDEGTAPPFGIAVHSSARAFAPDGDWPFRFIWHDWYKHAKPAIDPAELLEGLQKYFDWQKKHATMTGYAPDRIEHHSKLAREFFTSGPTSQSPSQGLRSIAQTTGGQ